ncbi:MAG: hypothetical protein WEB58_19920, partial [Planctomycetaceae bacterium]
FIPAEWQSTAGINPAAHLQIFKNFRWDDSHSADDAVAVLPIRSKRSQPRSFIRSSLQFWQIVPKIPIVTVDIELCAGDR